MYIEEKSDRVSSTNWLNKNVIIKKNGKIVFLGFIKWQKRSPEAVSYDNIHFYSTKNLDIKENFDPMGFYQTIEGLKVESWRNRHLDADVYLEREIDEEIRELVDILNTKWRTVGSCCGHNKDTPWVELQIEDYNSLLSLVKCIDDPWYLKILDSTDNKINLRLKTVLKGNKVIQDLEDVLRNKIKSLDSSKK